MRRNVLIVGLLWSLAGPLARGQEDPNTLINIQFQEDIRVFTVMAAINVAGFDYERGRKEVSGVRRRLVEELRKELPRDFLLRLQLFYEQHKKGVPDSDQHIDYTSLALVLTGPPGFQLNLTDRELPAGVWRVRGFQSLLKEFFVRAKVASVWERTKPLYSRELAGYIPVLRDEIQKALKYFRVPGRVTLDRRIILIPDLLNAHEIVNARNLERTYYIVVGPTGEPSVNAPQLQHEYLHSLVDPLVNKFGLTLLKHEKMLDLAQAQPDIRGDLQNRFLLVVGESMIETLQLRIRGIKDEAATEELVELTREGLIFAPHFNRSLIRYEKSELVSLPTYIDVIFKDIDESEVRKDVREMAALDEKRRLEEEARHAEIEGKNEEIRTHNRRVRALREATDLIRLQKYSEAERVLLALLEDMPDDGSALFYLGQVSSRTGRHQAAFGWYEKAVRSETLAWIRARSLVLMGRIAASGGRFEEARGHLRNSLAIADAPEERERDLKELESARAEARQLIEQLPPK